MKRLLIVTMLLMALSLSFATITYGTVSSSTVSSIFTRYEGLTTVVVADTATTYIMSPVFSAGNVISGKEGLIVGTVVTALKHTVSAAQSSIYAKVYVSIDGTNFSLVGTYPAYSSTTNIAGTVLVCPLKFISAAPYYRVYWQGQSALGVENTADMFGAIKTAIIVPNK